VIVADLADVIRSKESAVRPKDLRVLPAALPAAIHAPGREWMTGSVAAAAILRTVTLE
jgi:hypothetical protein